MADALALIEDGFREEYWHLLRAWELDPLLKNLPDERALAYGRDAARQALAPLIWRAAAGEVFETEQVRKLLNVSRQALGQRVERGTMLGLPAERTTLYPTWQFDGTSVRHVVSDIISAFRERLGVAVDPLLIASWAGKPQPELDEDTPAAWIAKGQDDERVVVAAKRAAEALYK